MTISILGSSITNFGELWNLSLSDLFKQSIKEAQKDADISPHQIDAVFVANKAAGSYQNQHHTNALVSSFFPHFPPSIRVEGACASGGLALISAQYALLSGRFKTVLVVGAEKMTDHTSEETTRILSGAADNQTEFGSTFPALYGILAKIHMQTFGTTREQISSVAVKNHKHALKNPHAQFHKLYTNQQVSQSSIVSDPLRLLDCSPISDGASAVILTTKKQKGKPKILGFGQAQDTLDLAGRRSHTSFAASTAAAKIALSESKINIDQIQAAEVHDCFTIAEILAIEDLGFFPKGSGGLATLKGQTTHGGKIIINPSGGLKACGHPVGATGIKQIAFLSKYLIEGQAKHTLAHNVGGTGATAVVHILGI